MWFLVIFLCCALSNIYCADYVQEVKVRLFRDENDNGGLKCEGVPSTLIINKPYRVYVNSPKVISIYRARCYIAGKHGAVVDDFVKEPLEQRLGYVSNIVSPSAPINDQYYNVGCVLYTKCDPGSGDTCHFYIAKYKYSDQGIKCNFKVDVVKEENIKVQSLGNLVINQTFFNVAGKYTYHFHDGEPTYFQCQKNTSGFVDLTYIGKDGTSVTTGYNTGNNVTMYMKLTTALHNNTVMVCYVYPDAGLAQVFQMILILKPRDYMKGIVGFKINQLFLPSYMQNGVLEHVYPYYSEEILMIEAVKPDNVFGDLNCYFKNPTTEVPFALTTYEVKNHLTPLKEVLQIFLYREQSNLYLKCQAQRLRGLQTFNSAVKFIYQPEDYSPYITGLSFARILAQYNDHESNRKIQYEYMGTETLKLRCADALGWTNWLYTIGELIVTADPKVPTIYYIQLYSNVNRTTIKCKSSKGKISSVELIRMAKATEITTVTPEVITTVASFSGNNVPGGNSSGDSSRTPKAHKEFSTTTKQRPTIRPASSTIKTKPTTKSTLSTSTISSTSISTTTAIMTTQTSLGISSTTNSINQSATKNDNNGNNGGNSYVILAVISIIALLLTITFVWAIMRLIVKRKRIPQRSNSSDIDYQNLPQHNEGPMPIPAQWSSQSNLYANTSGSTENLYSKPAPKHQRKPKLDPLYAQARDSKPIDTTYASVQNTEATYASIQNAEATYASIQNTEATYASIQNTEATYASIQNTEPTYASVPNTEATYAPIQNTEPTYAEVSKESAYQNLSTQSNSKDRQGPKSESQYAQFQRINGQNYVNVTELKKGFNKVCGNGNYANVNLK